MPFVTVLFAMSVITKLFFLGLQESLLEEHVHEMNEAVTGKPNITSPPVLQIQIWGFHTAQVCIQKITLIHILYSEKGRFLIRFTTF